MGVRRASDTACLPESYGKSRELEGRMNALVPTVTCPTGIIITVSGKIG